MQKLIIMSKFKLNQLIAIILFTGITHYSIAQDAKEYSQKQVLECARQKLDHYIEILETHYKDFGFTNKTELANIELGDPYKVFVLSDDFYFDENIIPDKNYLLQITKWRVPIVVDEQYKCFILAEVRNNNTLKAYGISGAPLAAVIDQYEKKHKLKGRKRKDAILEISEFDEFYLFKSGKKDFDLHSVVHEIRNETLTTWNKNKVIANERANFYTKLKKKI